MDRFSFVITTIIAVIVITVTGAIFIYQNSGRKEKTLSNPEISMSEQLLQGKSIAIIISFRDFRDAEYFIPRDALETAGAILATVSSQKGIAVGADGGEADVALELNELNPEKFDAVLFVGGPGMAKRLDDKTMQKIAQKTVEANKVLAAICIAPALLAKAGALKGRKATVWSSALDKSAVKILKEEGAFYLEEPVVIDGKVVTANGPEYAKEFAGAVIAVTSKQ